MARCRFGFVSNSSSSSFIVIANTHMIPEKLYAGRTLSVGRDGETEFGWEQRKYHSEYDRINFAYIQAMTAIDGDKPNQTWLDMLDKVVKEYTGANKVENLLSKDYNSDTWAYIDHASASYEGENIEMFESEEALKNFLFSNDSYIQGDNDNHA
jgi:hypothetical protein